MTAVLWVKFKRMRTDVPIYIIMTAMCLLLTFLFGNAVFGGQSTQRVFVIDTDGSATAAQFISAFGTDSYAFEYAQKEQAEVSVAKGEALAAIEIPAGFGEALQQGSATVTLIKTSDSENIYALENAITSAAAQTARVYALQDALVETLADTDIPAPSLEEAEQAYAEHMGEDAAVQVSYSVVGADDYEETFAENVHYLMGFNIFFVMFSVVFTVGGILEDKKLRTWNRIRISPLPGVAVQAGNFIPAFVVGVLQMAVVLFLGQWLFGIDLGAGLLPIFVIFIAFVLATTCLGLLLSALFSTYEQLGAATPVILVATAMLGGCMWPLSIVDSPVLLAIANAMPQKWALEAAKSLAVKGGGLDSVLTDLLVLLGMALLFFALSVMLYRRKRKA